MVSVCFYFQVHQPYRLKNYSVFDIGKNKNYYDEHKNKEIFKKVANKCYIPANNLIRRLIHKYPEFKVSYSMSGIFLEQAEEYYPKVIDSFKELIKTGNVELLDETYYHSLSFLYSKQEFKDQIKKHNSKIQKMFGYSPKIFRNTELIYNNEIGDMIAGMGYKGILSEGADQILGWRSPNFVYNNKGEKSIALLLKNYKLSDDIAFRFSEKKWKEWPLTTEKFADWVSRNNGNGNVINLFMDYETFGEHQWAHTGIFKFMENLPKEILKNKDNDFLTPCEVVDTYEPVSELDVNETISWADVERDISAWTGNKMQQSAINRLYRIEPMVKNSRNKKLIEDWRKLQTSDHFYYMCTKWFSDGDVHKYFNPYDSPYDSFITFMNILKDLELTAVGGGERYVKEKFGP